MTSVGQSTNQPLSLAGLIMIIYAILAFDSNTPSPSFYTLIPTIGTGLILVYANSANLTGQILGSNFLASIGLISYSTYLWHQPILAFAKTRSVHELTSLNLTALCAISLVLGYFSWKFVESPFRNNGNISSKSLLLLGMVFTVIFISLGMVGQVNKGFDSRLTEKEKAIADWQHYDFTETLRRYQCFMEPENTYLEFKMECFGEHTADAYLIWGDSYAAASSKGLRAVHADVIQLTASNCPPLINTSFSAYPNCLKVNDFIKEKVKELKPKKIYLQSNWRLYKNENIARNLYKTIDFIKHESPRTEIIILGSVPQWAPTLPMELIRKRLSTSEIEYVYLSSYSELEKIDIELINLAKEQKVNYISILDQLCIENKCLAVTVYKSKFWLTAWDSGHLTEAGSVYLFEKLKSVLAIN